MIRTRGRKIIADVMARKGRTALVVLSIMIGVFGVTTLVGMNDLVVSQLNKDLKPDEIAMTHVYTVTQADSISLEENREYLNLLDELPGVTRVEGQAVYFANWRKADADPDAKYIESNILAYTEPFGEVQLEPIARVVDGKYPQPGMNQIAVDQRFGDKFDVGVGDRLVFRQVGGEDSEVIEWEISAVVFHPYFTISISEGSDIDAEDNIYALYEDAQQFAGFPGLSSFYLRYTDVETARDGEAALLRTIQSETPYNPVFVFPDDPDDNFIINQVKNVTGVLNILAAVSMIVSGFLVTNVINAIVVEQKRQIGVMKSLGATGLDNVIMFAGMALVYGIIGVIFGIPLGIVAGSILGQELAPLAGTLIEDFTISWTAVIIGIVLGLAVPVIASLIPVFNGTRVTILEAMTDLGISSDWGKSRLSRWIGALPLPINIRQALSNLAQKKARLALTGFTLTLAVGAFMGVTAVFVSLGDELDSLFDTLDYEIQVTPQTAQEFETVQTLIADNIEGVGADDVYAGFSVSVGVIGYESLDPINEGSDQLNVLGIDPSSPIIKFDLAEGNGWGQNPDPNGIIVTRPVADALDKGVNDTLVISLGGQTFDYEIIGIDRFPVAMIFFEWRELATIADYVDEDTREPVPRDFYVRLSGDPSVDDVEDQIDVLNDVLLANGIQASLINQPAVAEESAGEIQIFNLIFNMTSGVMAAVGAIGLLATLSMAVYERQKEIGVMRSIGAGSGTIVVQFLVEGLIVGIIAWLVAIPLSILLGYGLSSALGFGDAFSFSYPPTVIVIGFILTIFVATVASIWPSISAARRTVSDILRYQ